MDGAMTQDVRVTNVYQGKKLQFIGVLSAVIGIIVVALAWPSNFDESMSGLFIGIGIFLVGALLAASGKAKHWYHAE